MIMNFRDSDHLINGEGEKVVTAIDSTTTTNNNCLSQRIIRLVSEKTKQGFEPTLDTHRILLVTHLSYYGYCFNPVSFYYIQNKQTQKTDAVVAEVSNTPWGEMYCYVLHEKSVDDVSVSVLLKKSSSSSSGGGGKTEQTDNAGGGGDDDNDENAASSSSRVNYVFPKAFHVSPFMEMTYKYDWTFSEKLFTMDDIMDEKSNKSDDECAPKQDVVATKKSTILIVNDMRSVADDQLTFRARMLVHRKSLHPLRAAYHMAMFPVYCMIIQIWIHYEAFRLFVKGVTFQPHPQGSETTASRIIGNLMAPFFAVQDMLQQQRQGKIKES